METSGREHDAILYDLASGSQTRIDIRQAGSPVCSKSVSYGSAACIVKLTRLSANLTHSLGSVSTLASVLRHHTNPQHMHVCLVGTIRMACASVPQVGIYCTSPYCAIRGSSAACICLRGEVSLPCATVAQ